LEKRKWDAYWKHRHQELDRKFAAYQYRRNIFLVMELMVVPMMLIIMLSIADRSWYMKWWWWCIYLFFIFLPRVVFLFPKTKPRRQYWQHAVMSLFHWIVLLSPFLLLWSDRLWIRILIIILIPLDAYLLLLFLGTLGS